MVIKLRCITFLVVILSICVISYAQQKGGHGFLSGLPPELSIGGYIDTYISYDDDKDSQPRQFSAIAPYRDEFRINLAMLSLRYAAKKIRGNIVLQYGDIPKQNWPQGPNEFMQFLQEANLGFSPAKNLWLDAGYFLTHIGGEGVIPKDNFFQSLSLCAYYEPFYQSGIHFSYTGKKFYFGIFALNGYNVLADNNKNKSFGLQLGYKAGEKAEFIYNNIIGNEMPTGRPGKTRIYNNFVIKWFPAKRLDIILCTDFCTQDESQIGHQLDAASLLSGFLSLRFRVGKKVSLSARGEFFNDSDGILSGTFTGADGRLTGLIANGFSLGIEYNPVDNSYFRLESRYLSADSNLKIFHGSNSNRTEVILSGGMGF